MVTPLGVTFVGTSATGRASSPGRAKGDGEFRYEASLGGYVFNPKTTGLTAGTYELSFVVSDDPIVHTVHFLIR